MNDAISDAILHDAFNSQVVIGFVMQVVVLAGGVGFAHAHGLTMFQNSTPMLDATLLERVVEGVPADLVEEVVVAGGYKVDQIKEYFNKADVDFDVRIVPEDKPLGNRRCSRQLQRCYFR